MSHKTQFLGPLASGLDTGAPATTTKSYARFTTWTPITTLGVNDAVAAVLPGDAILSEINVWKAGSFVGEAVFKFASVTGSSKNLGQVTVTATNSIYRAYTNSTTAQTTLPYGHAKVSANPTPIYYSMSQSSGTLTALTSAAWIEIVYTRVGLADRPDLVAAMKANDTTFQGPIISGAQDVGIPARASFGNLQTVQQVTAAAAPVTAQVVGVLPYGGQLSEINFYNKTTLPGDALVRFAAGTDGDNLGSVSVSAAGVYRVALTTALRTIPASVNTGSSQPIRMSIVSGNGSFATLAGVAEIVFTRHGQSEGYVGVGLKETTFQGPIGSGRLTGQFANRQDIGWGRLSRLTTRITSTNGVVSGQLVGFIPIGAVLNEINYIAATAAAGHATVRATNLQGTFTSDLFGSVVVSGEGVWSVVSSTAPVAFGYTGVNRAVSGATAQPVYIHVAAASGSIAALSGNAAIEIVYTRLDPSIYGV
jgi:hypothetical protein